MARITDAQLEAVRKYLDDDCRMHLRSSGNWRLDAGKLEAALNVGDVEVVGDQKLLDLAADAQNRGWKPEDLWAACGEDPEAMPPGDHYEVVKSLVLGGDEPEWLEEIIQGRSSDGKTCHE